MNQYASTVPLDAGGKGEGLETRPLGILSGRNFCVSKLFSKQDHAIASQVVCENGGTVVSPPAADYLLTPLEGVWSRRKGVESELERVEGTTVTMIWLVSE